MGEEVTAAQRRKLGFGTISAERIRASRATRAAARCWLEAVDASANGQWGKCGRALPGMDHSQRIFG